ncbi:MAG: SUMF1/EgtB/PvdO family nonheme iron enzyme [Bacteroidales bacterium]|nr:SUMF1/EgtB/PvdO family nonheme iron enzyme [Bacteroidales bacterium]
MYEFYKNMRNNIITGLTIILLSSCKTYDNGQLTGIKSMPWSEPNPYGMVLVQQGSFEMGQAEEDSVFGLGTPSKNVSVSPFWMDETEITNGQYKQFIKWVCDSITREKLADPAFGGNEEYQITEDSKGEPVKPHLNWRIPVPNQKQATEEELTAINYLKVKDPISGGYRINPDRILYRYEWFDYAAEAKRANQLNAIKRIRNTDVNAAQLPNVMISKDTAYITENGQVVNTTITRPLSSRYDFLHTHIVAIYPDTTCWVNDFTNSYNEPYLLNYFSHPAYNAHPVVGVSWEQAVAFCHWRTAYLNATLGQRGQKALEYRLPTEAEWELAARGKQRTGKYPWKSDKTDTERGCYYANFKPSKGGYTNDGHIITSKVASYPPNEYGLYDMSGNVSEWTSSIWSESSYEEVNDLNPDLQEQATQKDTYINKRKVVRGGSWKDAARFIRVNARSNEYQNENRSFIGFRCVRSVIGEK